MSAVMPTIAEVLARRAAAPPDPADLSAELDREAAPPAAPRRAGSPATLAMTLGGGKTSGPVRVDASVEPCQCDGCRAERGERP
jgi:hypothetical protein